MSWQHELSAGPLPPASPLPAWRLTRWQMSTEGLALCASLFFALACNGAFFAGALAGRSGAEVSTWIFAGAMLVLIAALHFLLLGLVLHRWIARPLLSVLIVLTAAATFYMQKFGVVLDPGMLRNVLHTDLAEARELLGWQLVMHLLLYALAPLLLLWRVTLVRRPMWRALLARAGALGLAVLLIAGSLFLVFQDFSTLMRNQKSLRYLITPANYLYSTARALKVDQRQAKLPRVPVGTDAHLGAAWAAHAKPALFVIVVGETARAMNWGLNGYARQTTPELAQLDVLNFRDVTACGTNTETSLPCMFSEIGRHHYDEDRIRGSESLLHVLAHAGFKVQWRDNQSGCKGVCEGLPATQVDATPSPDLCARDRCFDEMLLNGLDAALAQDAQGNRVLVLHMLGNHGPEYFNRYPEAFRRFTPTCDTGELRKCSTQQIVNTYDNALLYTDHVLARTIAFLKAQEPRFDTAMVYVSDHGESLGEKGLYLHGLPRAIAPSEQLKVPMVWWLSPSFSASFGLDRGCLASQLVKPFSHDGLFHSVLGLLQVDTKVYDRTYDISAGCRG